jgi:hypothetical protein
MSAPPAEPSRAARPISAPAAIIAGIAVVRLWLGAGRPLSELLQMFDPHVSTDRPLLQVVMLLEDACVMVVSTALILAAAVVAELLVRTARAASAAPAEPGPRLMAWVFDGLKRARRFDQSDAVS